jgi:diadenosine tetraphosphate (Ap4A) HIT family hydrolase
MENINSNIYSHLTVKERVNMSLPAKILLEKGVLKGRVLDFGCGLGKDVELLKQKGFDITGYDPFYFPELPTGKFDTIICFYVLNILLPIEQATVLMDVSHFLKETGTAFFSVRRDIAKDGFRTHFIHQKPVYQCNVKLSYQSIFQNQNVEIYQYQHYTTLNAGNESVSPFLIGNSPRQIIVESATAFSLFDKYPLSIGHALVIPKRKIFNYFDLTFREQSACWFMVNRVKSILQNEFNPDAFNIGLNNGETAGQTIPHVHIHVIPRYKGDVENPIGGIRNIFKGKGDYLKSEI